MENFDQCLPVEKIDETKTNNIGETSSGSSGFKEATSDFLNIPPSPTENVSSPSRSENTDQGDETETGANTPQSTDDEKSSDKLIMNITEAEDKLEVQPAMQLPQTTRVPDKSPDPRIPPKVDCPEKIIFCVDMSSDMNEPPFKLGNGGQFSPMCMVKRVIEMFVHNKLRINRKHEFAVLGFHETAIWIRDFTSDVKEVIAALDEIKGVKVCKDSALTSVFTLISMVASEIPSFSKPEVVPPPFLYRTILIYGRSNCIPQNIKDHEALKVLKSSPYFFLDILYIHETPSDENKCQEIFECLCDLDENDISYIFEVARNTTKLHNCMAKLLAHPLQRPLQKYTYYKLPIVEVEN